jgi:hypothetical protein
MAVLRPARLRPTALGLLAMVAVCGPEEGHHLRRMAMGDRVVVTWVAEGEAALAAEEISEEMVAYLQESGGVVRDYQSRDIVDMEVAEAEAEVATELMLCVSRQRRVCLRWVEHLPPILQPMEQSLTTSYGQRRL